MKPDSEKSDKRWPHIMTAADYDRLGKKPPLWCGSVIPPTIRNGRQIPCYPESSVLR